MNQDLSSPLMNTTVLQIQSDHSIDQSTFIKRYNIVINCYNKHLGEGGKSMEVIICNRFVYRVSEVINSKISVLLIILCLAFVPFINMVCIGGLFVYLCYLSKENRKHNRNLNRVNDPFQGFYFQPEMCESMGKHFAVLNLTQKCKQLQGFTFNIKQRERIQSKLRDNLHSSNDESLTVIIYDQFFYDSFYLYRLHFYKTLIGTIMGLFLTILSNIVFFKLFGII